METQSTNEKIGEFVDKQFEEVEEEFDSFFSLMKHSLVFLKVHFLRIFSFFFLLLVVPNLFGLMLKKLILPVISTGHPLWFSGLVVLFYSLLGLAVSVTALMINFGSCRLIYTLDNYTKETLAESFLNILKSGKTILFCMLILVLTLSGATLAFIIPALFLGVGVIFVNQFVLIEKKTAKEAILQSLWYTKNKKINIILKIFLALLFCLLFSNFVFSIKSLIFSLVPNVFRGNVFNFLVGLSDFAISAIAWSFLVTFTFFLWKNIKKVTKKTPDKEFEEKYKKIIKVFSILGFILILSVFVLGVIFSILNVSKEIEAERLQQLNIQK